MLPRYGGVTPHAMQHFGDAIEGLPKISAGGAKSHAEVRRYSEAIAGCEKHAESNLQVATALNPVIGYDKATVIVKEATASGRPVREVAREHGVDEAVLTKALDLRKIARGNKAR